MWYNHIHERRFSYADDMEKKDMDKRLPLKNERNIYETSTNIPPPKTFSLPYSLHTHIFPHVLPNFSGRDKHYQQGKKLL